jgi:hypothetical protein
MHLETWNNFVSIPPWPRSLQSWQTRTMPQNFVGSAHKHIASSTMAFTSSSNLVSILLLLASATSKATDACQICPDGGMMDFPNKPVILIAAGPPTCAIFESWFEGEGPCALRDASSFKINLASFCGCPEGDIPDICSLCGPGEEISDPTAVLPYASADGSTCGSVADYARHLVDAESCEDLKLASSHCCTDVRVGKKGSSLKEAKAKKGKKMK